MSFSPYLFFSGNCAEAFAFYSKVFGVDAMIVTNADMPSEEAMPDAGPATVMHAAIDLNGSVLMGSDDPSGTVAPNWDSRSPTRHPTSRACRPSSTLSLSTEA